MKGPLFLKMTLSSSYMNDRQVFFIVILTESMQNKVKRQSVGVFDPADCELDQSGIYGQLSLTQSF